MQREASRGATIAKLYATEVAIDVVHVPSFPHRELVRGRRREALDRGEDTSTRRPPTTAEGR